MEIELSGEANYGLDSFLCKSRTYHFAANLKTEVVGWQTAPAVNINKLIYYVPGLPGDTLPKLDSFISSAKNRSRYLPNCHISAILHSGILNQQQGLTTTEPYEQPHDLERIKWTYGSPSFPQYSVVNGGRISNIAASNKDKRIEEVGAMPDDWIDDVKIALSNRVNLHGIHEIKIIAHSFGGLFALVGLGELVHKGVLQTKNLKQHPLTLILVSAPIYDLDSLPDRKAILGSAKVDGFSFFEDAQAKDKTSDTDSRIPMASEYVFSRIWDFLQMTNSIKVHPDKDFFNIRFRLLFKRLAQLADDLKTSGVKIVSLTPYLDRWVSESGAYLKKLLGDSVLVEKFDIPSAAHRSTVTVNAHDLLDEWLPIALKF